MLARDYNYVGSNGSIAEAWATGDIVGEVGSIGSDQDGAITISDRRSGNVQVWRNNERSRQLSVGRKGRSPGEFMQPCQTALSADSTVLAVADSGNNRVQLFDTSTRKPGASVGTRGQFRPGRMQTPEGVVFVDGRCEMIVADTGNNRLQVFHVDMMAGPHVDGGRTFEGLFPFLAVGDTPPRSKPPVALAQSSAPFSSTKASSERSQKPSPLVGAVERRPGERNLQEETSAAGTSLGEVGDLSSRACLLVFTGGEAVGSLRKRRTAGESEAAEGALCQPCDLAYWRPRTPRRRAEGHTSPSTWTPEPPRWFWPHTSRCSPGSPFSDVDDEEEARRALLPPDFRSPNKTVSSRGEKNATEGPASNIENTGHVREVGDALGGGMPLLGAFLVRETRLHGELQLLFVARTKEAEADGSAAYEDEDPEYDLDSALLEHTPEEDGSGSLDWMKQTARSATPNQSGDGLAGGRLAEGINGTEDRSFSRHSSPIPTPVFEVREKTITVEDEGKAVEICGRVYDSLLSLLRGFRWGGFERLVGVTDTRGDRGVVAVAERGGGRVRLLHYAPAFPPFYAAELTHFHSIEGLQRPSSVSFSPDGDLLVVDQGARKVLVYSHLSGRWVRVRRFGPDSTSHVRGGDNTNGTDAQVKSRTDQSATAENRENRGESAHEEDHPLRGPNACSVRASSRGKCPEDASVGAASRGQEHDEAGHAQKKQDRTDKFQGWAIGTPVSARFMRRKNAGLGPCTPLEDDSPREEIAELVVVVASSDGVVRTLCGPRKRNFGSFALLDEGTALSIFELLGYRSSKVLGHVSRATADLRSRLRWEWRLHPLTPGQLARRTLEFLQWGRLSTGEGLPGRGTSVDESGKQLCDQFLSTSSCCRPACPYSHDQPWVGAISDNNTDACIVFRGGVRHAVNNLYGQVFGWEWEGELYRLFLERSFRRTMVTRRDPMSLGVHGAEAVRKCEKKVDRVLDYPGFVDFVTVVHEHVLGLRSWHQWPVPAAMSQSNVLNTGATFTSRVDHERSAASLSPEAENCGVSTSKVDGQRSVHQGATSPGRKAQKKTPATQRPSADIGSVEVTTELHLQLKGESRKLDAATPWLGWDFATSKTSTRETEHCSCTAAVSTTIPAPGGENLHNGQEDDKAEPKDRGNNDQEGARRGREGEEQAAEEPKMNRTYGGADNDHGASANMLFAFQTDRVVRRLDDIF